MFPEIYYVRLELEIASILFRRLSSKKQISHTWPKLYAGPKSEISRVNQQDLHIITSDLEFLDAFGWKLHECAIYFRLYSFREVYVKAALAVCNSVRHKKVVYFLISYLPNLLSFKWQYRFIYHFINCLDFGNLMELYISLKLQLYSLIRRLSI